MTSFLILKSLFVNSTSSSELLSLSLTSKYSSQISFPSLFALKSFKCLWSWLKYLSSNILNSSFFATFKAPFNLFFGYFKWNFKVSMVFFRTQSEAIYCIWRTSIFINLNLRRTIIIHNQLTREYINIIV